jgi:hypothetical protein
LSKYGELDESIQLYEKILKKDTYNPIAKKNLEKIRRLKTKLVSKSKTTKGHSKQSAEEQDCPPISPSLFLADAQKTKTVKLINLAPREELQSICIGQQVYATKRRFELQVKDSLSTYLGTFPDDVGRTFMKYLDRQSPFSIYIKDLQDNLLVVFIKY